MMIKNRSTAALAALVTAALVSTVWAATTTNAPGAYCVASSGTLKVRSDGEVENATASTATAICPTERPMGAGAATKLSGTAFVIDRSSAADVCCRVVSKNAGGAIVQSAPVCSSGNSTSYQQLALPQITDAFGFSHYFVQCDVPPINAGAASRIQMYRTTLE